MGLSRNKVAVPEGAAGTPPFWRDANIVVFLPVLRKFVLRYKEKDEAESVTDKVDKLVL